MVALIAKNVHWFWSMTHRVNWRLASPGGYNLSPELSVEGLLSGTGIGCHQKRSLLSTGDE
ncbi:hypothetical protein [Bradyrhizobium sp. BR 1432]|uniref:hypothetical protein n=1 Tax=Bradyrhizobium sp. BR 1432 TaxID=3447966 RepID=UPI003EE4854F